MATKWKVEIEISNIKTDSDEEYDNKISEIVQAIKMLGYEEIYVGIGEEDG